MFGGFNVAPGTDRFGGRIQIGGEPNDCKVFAQDTGGAMCVFECTGTSCGPRHLHHDQDEWIYVIGGEFDVQVGEKLFRARTGETVFLPRKVLHAWSSVDDKPGKVLDSFQPAGKMEEFFREVGRFTTPPIHEALGIEGLSLLFKAHGMELLGPPFSGEWAVDEEGRITRLA